jgi:hypothetical protein
MLAMLRSIAANFLCAAISSISAASEMRTSGCSPACSFAFSAGAVPYTIRTV